MKEIATQEYVHVRDILRDGTIITTEGKYVNILEVTPQNFFNKEEVEQLIILQRYERFLKKFPELSFRIKVVTQAMQTDTYADGFREAAQKEKNRKVKDMISDHIDFARSETSVSTIDRRFYFIFSYDPENPYALGRDEEEILNEMAKARNMVKADFKAMGNPIVEYAQEDQMHDIAKILYSFYNKRFLSSRPMDQKMERLIRDYEEVYQVNDISDLPLIDIRDLLCPQSVVNTERDYLIINGQYYAFLYMDGSDFPASISPYSWVSALINFGMGYDVDLIYEKQNRKESLKNLKLKKKITKPRAEEAHYDANNYEVVQQVDRDIDMLQDAIRKERQSIYQFYVLLTVSANTKQELYDKIDRLTDLEIDYDCTIKSCDKLQKEGFLSTMPCNDIYREIKKDAHHNITTDAVALAYPFVSSSMSDRDGVMLGVSLNMDGLIAVNNFDTKKYTSANMTVFGKSGTGKTFAMLCYTTRMRLRGIQNFIFSPDKQDEFRPVCDALGGQFIDVGASAKTRINPFDIWPSTSDIDNALYNKSGDEKSWLNEKIEHLSIFYKFYIDNITTAETVLLKRLTESMYRKKGITTDNDSIYKNKEKKILKEMPTFSDFVKELKEFASLEGSSFRQEIITIFEQFTEGNLRYLNGQTNVDLTNKYIVFGFENCKGDNTKLVPLMYIVLEYVMNVVRSDKTVPKIISLDEGWMLLDEKNPQVSDFVIQMFRTIRAYNGGIIFSTQSITDFYNAGEKVANAILANTPSNILLGMEAKAVDNLKEILKLTDEECNDIITFDRGQALLCAGRNHVPIKIVASPKEQMIYSTDPQILLQKLYMEGKIQ